MIAGTDVDRGRATLLYKIAGASEPISYTFSVTASGTALLMYQWKFNGTNIANATQSSYTKTNLQALDAGSYSVGITNAIGYSNSRFCLTM